MSKTLVVTLKPPVAPRKYIGQEVCDHIPDSFKISVEFPISGSAKILQCPICRYEVSVYADKVVRLNN